MSRAWLQKRYYALYIVQPNPLVFPHAANSNVAAAGGVEGKWLCLIKNAFGNSKQVLMGKSTMGGHVCSSISKGFLSQRLCKTFFLNAVIIQYSQHPQLCLTTSHEACMHFETWFHLMAYPSCVGRGNKHLIPIHFFYAALSVTVLIFLGSGVLNLLNCLLEWSTDHSYCFSGFFCQFFLLYYFSEEKVHIRYRYKFVAHLPRFFSFIKTAQPAVLFTECWVVSQSLFNKLTIKLFIKTDKLHK